MAARASIDRVPFGRLHRGGEVERFVLRNRRGMEAQILSYGGIVMRLTAPDRHRRYADVALGHRSLAAYLADDHYLGGIIGRHANRIACASFQIDGVTCHLDRNNGRHSLHGGALGFDRVLWKATDVAVNSSGVQLRLEYLSPDGEQGYPGALSVAAVYTLADDDSLRLECTATTDRPTVVNLTQHSYFNLSDGSHGSHGSDVLGHVLQIHAQRFTPTDDQQIPTGELRAVAGTAFDFRQPTAIGACIGAADEQLRIANGYDHNWVIDKPPGTLAVVASVYEPLSGRRLQILSNQPGLQFYSGNSLDGRLSRPDSRSFGFRSGLCLEPQHFPDSPNRPEFPSVVLRPGAVYENTIIHRLTAE
jgi:aldose 1-epimerase